MEVTVNQEYINKYVQKFTEQLCKQFFFNKAFITGKEILTFSPSSQVNMFILKNLFLNWQKETQKLKSPFFNYEDPEVKQALKQFMNKLSNHIHVYQYDFVPLVHQAVKDVILLAGAPLDFFKKECETISNPQLTIQSIKDYLKYLQYNKCIFEMVLAEMEQRGLNEMYAGEGVRLIHRVLSENTHKLEKPEVILESISAVMPCVLSDFFMVQKPVTAPEIKTNTAAPDKAIATVDIPEDITSNSDATSKSTDQELLQGEVIPIHKEEPKVASKVKDRASALAELASQKSSLTISAEKSTLNDAFKSKKENASLSEKIGKSKLDSIQRSIPFHLKFVFINMLFNGDQNLWQEAINKVDAAASYQDALAVLNNEYAPLLKWDPKDEHLESLFELIERKFN